MEYVIGDKYGKSGVKSILDKLKINKSAEFNKHCSVFKKTHNEIWNQLPGALEVFLFQLLMMTYSPYCIIIIKNKLNSLLNNVIYKNEKSIRNIRCVARCQ